MLKKSEILVLGRELLHTIVRVVSAAGFAPDTQEALTACKAVLDGQIAGTTVCRDDWLEVVKEADHLVCLRLSAYQ